MQGMLSGVQALRQGPLSLIFMHIYSSVQLQLHLEGEFV
jgi:hypothetical protein